MEKIEFERILCDDLWNVKNKNDTELGNHLHCVNTFERLGIEAPGNGVQIILHDGSIFNLKIDKVK